MQQRLKALPRAAGAEDGCITLIPRNVSFGGGWVKASHDRVHIWKQPEIWLRWLMEVEKTGKYEVLMKYVANKTQADTPFEIDIGGRMLTGRLVDTQSGSAPREFSTGTVDIPATGAMNLTFKPGRGIGKEHFRQPMVGIWHIKLKPAE